MKKKIILFLLILTIHIGCNFEERKIEGVNFEAAEYYDSFLFVPAKQTPTFKKIKINFNDWAIYNNAYVTLLMYCQNDPNSTPFYLGTDSSPLLSLYLNDKLCKDGEIKLNKESEKTLDLRIEFSPEAKEGLYSGYIVVKDSEIDRINNIENISNQSKIFEWSVRYNIVMNPLKLGLACMLLAIVLSLLIWFLFVQPFIYPKMRKGTIMINAPYTKVVRIAGGRKLVFASYIRKQKVLNKIFAGKILYETNPFWENEIVFYPKDKRNLRILLSSDYTITPYTNIINRGKSYEIKKGNEFIKLSFL